MADYTADDLAALQKAYASGVTKATIGDKSVEYRSLADMRRLISEIETKLSGRTRRRQIRIRSTGDRGL